MRWRSTHEEKFLCWNTKNGSPNVKVGRLLPERRVFAWSCRSLQVKKIHSNSLNLGANRAFSRAKDRSFFQSWSLRPQSLATPGAFKLAQSFCRVRAARAPCVVGLLLRNALWRSSSAIAPLANCPTSPGPCECALNPPLSGPLAHTCALFAASCPHAAQIEVDLGFATALSRVSRACRPDSIQSAASPRRFVGSLAAQGQPFHRNARAPNTLSQSVSLHQSTVWPLARLASKPSSKPKCKLPFKPRFTTPWPLKKWD